MKKLLIILTIIFGFLSSICWLISAHRSRKYSEKINNDGFVDASISISDGNDVIETMKIQAHWNKWAAFFAAITSFLQVLSEFL